MDNDIKIENKLQDENSAQTQEAANAANAENDAALNAAQNENAGGANASAANAEGTAESANAGGANENAESHAANSENSAEEKIAASKTESAEEPKGPQNDAASQEEHADLPVYVPNTESEVMLFLGDELEPLRRTKSVNVYDLETEYAKTRKNKMWSVWIMLVLTFSVVVLVTVFTVGGLSVSNQKIEVNFSSFKDLDLQNLFNQLQRTQENFDEASKRCAELRGALETRLSRAKIKYDNDLSLLKNTRLSRSALKSRKEKIEGDYNSEVAAIHREIDSELATAEAELKQYEEQLKSYDSENVARAQEWEQQMDSERQIYQLEKQRLIESYENQISNAKKDLEDAKQKGLEDRLSATNEISKHYEGEISKFDPIINDSKTSGLLSEFNEAALQRFNAEALIASDPNITESFASALRNAQADYDRLEFLYGQSNSIPYRNTMKSVISSEQKLSARLANKIAQAAIEEFREGNSSNAGIIQQLKTAESQRDYAKNASRAFVSILNSSVIDAKIAGFVLNPASDYGVAIFVRSAYSPNVKQDGSTKVEIYSGENLLATGAVLVVSGNYYVSLDDDEQRKNLSVGNTFIIK